MSLAIRKKGSKNFFHYWDSFTYSASDLTIITNGTTVYLRAEDGRIVGLKDGWNITDVSVYDDTSSGTEETFATVIALTNRLVELGYPAYYVTGDLPSITLGELADVDLSSLANGETIAWNSSTMAWENSSAGSGDVTSASTIADNAIVRGDGGAKGVQQSGVSIDDSNNVTGANNVEVEGHSYSDGEVDNGNSSTADTIDWTVGNFQKSTLTDNCTYTFTAPTGATTMVLRLIQDGTGSRTATFPASVKWSGGTAPTLTTTASAVDLITFYYDGTNYNGSYILDLQ